MNHLYHIFCVLKQHVLSSTSNRWCTCTLEPIVNILHFYIIQIILTFLRWTHSPIPHLQMSCIILSLTLLTNGEFLLKIHQIFLHRARYQCHRYKMDIRHLRDLLSLIRQRYHSLALTEIITILSRRF